MVNSQVTSITAANHADEHRHGGDDPITGDVRIDPISFPIFQVGYSVSAAYEKVAEMKLDAAGLSAASLKISFDIAAGSDASTSYGRIYRNGAAVGTEQSVAALGAGGYQTKTESIAGWSDDDLLQLYVKKGTAGSVYAKNIIVTSGSAIIKFVYS